MSEVKWLEHTFEVCLKDANWNDVGGVYIFTGLNPQNRWVPLYIGQADSFRTRIPSHEQWSPAQRLGATHVHALVVEQAATRDKIEKELIRAYQPALNVQLK
jgi:excinuclease UvrABC nuclease subunit